MSRFSKILLVVMCAALIGTVSVIGTIAYLVDTAEVTNVISVGDVDITLDEAVVDEDGVPVDPAERTEEGNEYNLIPGKTYTKDPTITVKADSEDAYVRMIVKLDKLTALQQIETDLGKTILTDPDAAEFLFVTCAEGWDPATWVYEGYAIDGETIAYEFRYFEPVQNVGNDDIQLAPLFTSIKVPGVLTGSQLETLEGMNIVVTGHAIQYTGFDTDEDGAWAEFDDQQTTTP